MKRFSVTVTVTVTIAIVGLAFAGRSASAAPPPYGAAGPKAVKVEALNATTDIVTPTTGGPYPLIVASHGFSANGANQVGWAKHFASYGFVVAVPTFPSPLSPDTQVNAGVIAGLVNDLRQAAAASTHNILATAKVGLEGHSAGGLATTVAAEKLGPANVGAVVLFDPVDRDDVGKTAYAKVCSPLLDIFSAPSSCNTQASWRAFASSTGAALIGFDVVGSTHCDGENADRPLCGFTCGGAASPDRQKVYASYATAFLLSELMGDAAATTSISAANVTADATVAQPLRAARSTACGGSSPSNDGGADSGSGSSSSSSSGASGSSSSSSGAGSPPSSESPTANTASGSSDGCSIIGVRGGRSTPVVAILLVLALAATVRRRRRCA